MILHLRGILQKNENFSEMIIYYTLTKPEGMNNAKICNGIKSKLNSIVLVQVWVFLIEFFLTLELSLSYLMKGENAYVH